MIPHQTNDHTLLKTENSLALFARFARSSPTTRGSGSLLITTVKSTLPMKASKTEALSIAQAIDLLEGPLTARQKVMGGAVGPLMIVPEDGDVALLSEFIGGVNLELEGEVLVQVQLVALSGAGHSEWYGSILSAVPFAVIWTGIRKYGGASRCSLKVEADGHVIDVSAATPEEAERLFNSVARVMIYRIEDPPVNNPPNQES
jgi:hypothetical protein